MIATYVEFMAVWSKAMPYFLLCLPIPLKSPWKTCCICTLACSIRNNAPGICAFVYVTPVPNIQSYDGTQIPRFSLTVEVKQAVPP